MEPRFEIDPANGFFVIWPDAHQSRFPFASLRALCPCAACGGASTSGALRQGPSDPASIRLLRVEPVGRYAVCPVWGDGHASGIYSWDLLRSACDCLACRTGRRAEASS